MSDVESITRAELAAALQRMQYKWKELPERLIADIIAHREPEYEVGEIYQDSLGRRFVRRTDAIWSWTLVLPEVGDLAGNHHLHGYPVRPLRKLVPAGSSDDYAAGFTAGQEASDVG